MSVKRENCRTIVLSQKKKRKSVTLDIKLDVIERFKDGDRAVDIARDLGLQSSTVRTIRKNAEKITISAQSVTPLSAARLSRNRSVIMEKMETLLNIWIEEQHELNLSISLKSIQEKALTLFECLKQQLGDNVKNEKFSASRGWFERFKRRSNLHNTQVPDSSIPTDVSLSKQTELKEIISNIIKHGGYTPHQVFYVHKTCLFWKRLPAKGYLSGNEPAKKFFKDHMNILLGGNASGDIKLKPLLVYHEETPQEMEGYSKVYLPILWRFTKTAQVTKTVIEEWFAGYFCPTIEDYCKRNNFNKVLLIIENVQDPPLNLDDLSQNVQVVFISTTSSKHEPSMGQGGITAFKTLYIQRLLRQYLEFVDCSEEGEQVLNFWHTYNIMHAIDNIAEVWQEVNIPELNHFWKNIWPDLHNVNMEKLNQSFMETQEDVVALGQQAGLEEVEVGLVQKGGGRLSQKDLVLLKQQPESEGRDFQINNPPQSLSAKNLSEAFEYLSKAMAIFADKDSLRERSARVNMVIRSGYSCYRELYKHKKMIGA